MVYYEMKKIFSKTSGRIAVICLIGLLIVVCGFAVSGVSYMNEQGEKENGVAAVRKLGEGKKEWSGPLTEEKIGEVIAANLAVNNTEEYRSRDIRKSDIAFGWKQGFSDIRMLLVYAYGAFRDYDYYRPDSLVPEDAEAFYANRTAHLKEWLDTEAKDQFSEEEKAFLVEKYQEMETPLYYDYADGWKQLFEFAPTLLMIMVLILGFLAASLFSCEYQYKADSVFFASCHGRGRAVSAKIKAGFLLITGIYWLSVLLYVGIVLGILGADGANCVIQTGRGGWKSFYNITYWQEGLLIFAGGYAGCLFILFLTMLISAASRSAVVAVMMPFILIFVPSFLGGIRFPLINKILGLMPDQLLQMNMVVSYFNLYSIAGRIMGAAGIILVVYSVMTVMICPLLYRIYRKAQVK